MMLKSSLEKAKNGLENSLKELAFPLTSEDVGRVHSITGPVAKISGLAGVRSEELVLAEDGSLGIVANLSRKYVGIILLKTSSSLAAGAEVKRLGRVADVVVGEALLGRVIDATGKPLDERGPLPKMERRPIERPAPEIMRRTFVRLTLWRIVLVFSSAPFFLDIVLCRSCSRPATVTHWRGVFRHVSRPSCSQLLSFTA